MELIFNLSEEDYQRVIAAFGGTEEQARERIARHIATVTMQHEQEEVIKAYEPKEVNIT